MPALLELIDLPVDPDRCGGMVVPPGEDCADGLRRSTAS